MIRWAAGLLFTARIATRLLRFAGILSLIARLSFLWLTCALTFALTLTVALPLTFALAFALALGFSFTFTLTLIFTLALLGSLIGAVLAGLCFRLALPRRLDLLLATRLLALPFRLALALLRIGAGLALLR